MPLNQYEDIFATTTPPSDFNDFDLSTVLACSPALSKIRCLAPDSLNRPHSYSISSNSTDMTGDMDLSFPNDDLSQEMYFSNSSFEPFQPIPMPSLPEMEVFGSSGGYSNYDQPQWIPTSCYSEPPSLMSYSDAPPLSIFPTFDAPSMSLSSNIVPPSLQAISDRSTFNFNTVPQQTMVSQSFLATSPAFSQALSRTGSMPSLSRSCSPDPPAFSDNTPDHSTLSVSTAASSNSTTNLGAYGILIKTSNSSSAPGDAHQTWRCAYPGCTSRAVFTRGCDLRKHYNRHSKHLFCRVDGCPQSAPRDVDDGRRGSISATGGFSSKKDRARHEAKHNPGIRCEWQGADDEECGRVFSRMDNMKDHVRRIHQKGGR